MAVYDMAVCVAVQEPRGGYKLVGYVYSQVYVHTNQCNFAKVV